MVTVLIIAAVLSVVVGLWLLNQKQAKDLKEANDINPNVHPWIDDLAPEVTPAPIAETMAKKKVAKKKPASKNTAKNKSLAKMEVKLKKKSTKK